MFKFKKNGIAYGKAKKVIYLLKIVMPKLIKFSKEYFKYKKQKNKLG